VISDIVIGKDHRRQITARIQCSTVFRLIPARASIVATYVMSLHRETT
jgi:hypothetical protein